MKAAEVISDECSAIVFYGIDPSTNALARFYQTVMEWFNQIGYPPDKAGIKGPGHSGKVGLFSRGDAKLKKSGFDGLESVELLSSTPGAKTGHDYFVMAAYNGTAPSLSAQIVARSSLARLSTASMLPTVQSLIQILKPAYGIGYRREHRLGPELYAVGICYGGDDVPTGEAYEEARNISRWCDMGMVEQVYRKGLLRDVYPWNFLTRSQLDQPVSGISLEHWIHQNARRGTLRLLCDGVFLWEVEDAELPILRQTLHQAGIIFDWRKYSSNPPH